jgi:tetratricopeptide (TPR) repeat protein
VGAAARAVAELARFASDSPRLRAWHTCFAGQLAVLTDPQSLHATSDAVAAAAQALAAAGDTAGEAKAHSVHALALARLGKGAGCEAALDRALAAARRANDRRLANTVLAGAPLAALWGPSPVTRASGRCLDVVRVLRITQGAPAVEAVALRCQAVLEALRGRADAARRMIGSSRRMVEELGLTQQLLETDVFSGHIDLIEGEAAAAERSLRSAYHGLREQGLGIDAARAAALLARALLAQGRAAEAEALSQESESLAGDDLQAAIAWRGVRAEALVRRGEHARAVELARAAVEIAAGTDALLHHADARLALATALRAAGRAAEADAEERRAIELWVAKGASLLAERVRRGAGRATPVTPESAEPRPSAYAARRRVRPNAATAYVTRFDAIVAARDADALSLQFADDMVTVNHPLRTETGREAGLSRFEMLLRAEGLAFGREPLATLGDSLALCHSSTSLTALGADDIAPIGAIDISTFVWIEVDSSGRHARRAEIFAADRLGDAIARLYERHAELLPEGPSRTRAAVTARSFAVTLGPPNLGHYVASFADDIAWDDHRTMGFGSLRGRDAVVRGFRTLFEMSEYLEIRVEDVLGLEPRALLTRWTVTGTDRAAGTAFERRFLQAWTCDRDGRLNRVEQFDADREDEALARFGELAAESLERPARRVRPNAATANAARMDAAVAARDLDAFYALFADDAVQVHHPTGTSFAEREARRAYKAMLAAESLAFGHEPLATLGDSLALCYGGVSFAATAQGFGVFAGAANMDSLAVLETDSRGLRARTEFFALDRLGDAIARLYERYAESLPDGPERTRAAGAPRWLATIGQPVDLERFAAAYAPSIEYVDHRFLGVGAWRGADHLIRGVQAMLELTADSVTRVDDILDLRPGCLLVRATNVGTERAHGGAYERPALLLWTFGPDGLLTHLEQFDVGREADALARLDAVTAESIAPRFSNAALRSVEEMERCWTARDWPGLVALFAADYRSDDRRSVVGLPLSGQDFFVNLRAMFDLPKSRWRLDPLATRGDTLALLHSQLSGEAYGGGEVVFEHLSLVELDGAGLRKSSAVFDVEDLDTAYAELDRRFAAGEGAPHLELLVNLRAHLQAVSANDMDAVRRILPADLTVTSHRKLASWGKTLSRDEYLASYAGLGDFGDLVTQVRADHLLISRTAGLVVSTGRGTFGGSAFERPLVTVFAHDGSRSRSLEEFDLEQLAAARARFEELSAESPAPSFANAASRTMDRFARAWRARDWPGVLATFVPTHRMDDRRKLMRVEIAGEEFLANERMLFESAASHWDPELLATRGERLALLRMKFTTEVDGSGPMAVEMLDLVEVDPQGRRSALVVFDLDSLEAAYAELDRRYAAGEGAQWAELLAHQREVARALGSGDTAALARLLPDDFTSLNRQRFGGTGQAVTRDQIVANGQFRADLDVRGDMRLEHVLRVSASAAVVVMTWYGTLGGGEFENAYVVVATHDGRRLHAWEAFDADQLDRALARYDELVPARVTSRIENAATRTIDRYQQAWAARDPKAAAATLAAGFRQIDRRRLMRLDLDKSEFLAFSRETFGMTLSRLESQILATRGERLALARLLFTGAGDSVGPTEIESLAVIEVDEHGDRLAMVRFDADSLDAAYAELDDRYAAGEAAPHASLWANARRFYQLLGARDWTQLESLFTPDLVLEDHRPLGWGTLHSLDEYSARLRALVDLAPDARLSLDHVLALDERGTLVIGKSMGSREGGAFEIPTVTVGVAAADGRVARCHMYDLHQLEEARARFESLTLRSDPLRIPPNAATRAADRLESAFEASDWTGLETLCVPELVFDDRRPFAQLTGDRDTFLASSRVLVSHGSRFSREVLATAGDRLALERRRWTTAAAGVVDSEITFLCVTEVDTDGRFVAIVAFDPDDRRAASAELHERYERDPSTPPVPLRSAEFLRALRDHDLEAIRRELPENFAFIDRRRVGAGRLEGRDAYLPWLEAMFEQSPDAFIEPLYYVAVEKHASLAVAHTFGTLASGGEFDSVFVLLGTLGSVELFELEDLELARARFEELRPDPLRIPPNAASRLSDSAHRASDARDWDGLAALCAPDMVWDDRRRRALVTGGRDTFVANIRVMVAHGSKVERTLLATAGDRLCLLRMRRRGATADIGGYETENIVVNEVDTEGRAIAIVGFDPEDRRAASLEMFERWARSEEARSIPATTFEGIRAMNAHDLERLRAVLPSDFVLHDHRRTGLGRIEGGDAFAASLAAVFALAGDWTVETLYVIANEPHGELAMARAFGTNADGGEFEAVYLRVIAHANRMELFEPDELERARARFDELRPRTSP